MGKKHKRLVIKVGTSTLTNAAGSIDREYITSLAAQIAEVKSKGYDVLLVTSGAIRAGMEQMGLIERPKTIPEKQAAAAVGQGLLMRIYSDTFAWHEITTAQVLLTREDFGDRTRYLNARNTMITLLKNGVVPVVNENDTVATDEIKVGDNDNLAALVASALHADLLVLLSDVQGLYSADPRSEGARLISVVDNIDANIRGMAGGAGTKCGTGGMHTKIEAADIAVSSGVKMIIADGRAANVLPDIISGGSIGTAFVPKKDFLKSRKRWIAFAKPAKGSLVVNNGALNMIRERGKSLLPAGIISVVGSFSSGDMVKIIDEDGNTFARGFVNYSADEIRQIQGKHSSQIAEILGHKDFDEVIHRDNMALNS